jgi:hypothetical protein
VCRLDYQRDDRKEIGGLPRVPVNSQFTHHNQLVKTHNAVVVIGEKRFMVYGWSSTNRNDVTNESLLHVKPSTLWRGEILILCLGYRVPYMAQPRVKGNVLDEVAAL